MCRILLCCYALTLNMYSFIEFRPKIPGQIIQEFSTFYTNWVFSVELKKIVQFVSPSNSFIIIDSLGDTLVEIKAKPFSSSGVGTTRLKISPGGDIISVLDDVYQKLVITQVFAPLLNTHVVEVRLDGVLLHKEL